MKQTVIDILIYLFENFMDDEIDIDLDQNDIKTQLRDAGFDIQQVDKAIDWLQELSYATQPDSAAADPTTLEQATSTRVYTEGEIAKLDIDCRGFLFFLEQVGVVDGQNREVIIDRVMALDADEVDLEQLKWIVLMVMFNQPGCEQALAWMEEVVMDEEREFVH